MNSALYIGSSRYDGDTIIPEDSFTEYEDIWETDPSTGLDWTAAGASAISGFGYRAATVSAGESTLTGWVSQLNCQVNWWPIRPVVKIHLYINEVLTETSVTPIYESLGAATYQTASFSTIRHLHAGDEVIIKVQKTMFDDIISANSNLTNLSIHRLTWHI